MGLWAKVREAFGGAKVEPVNDRAPDAPVEPQVVPEPKPEPDDVGGPGFSFIGDWRGGNVIDLTALEAVELRVVGTTYLVLHDERAGLAADHYTLVLDPENEHDPNAVAVYSHRRRVGYLSAAKAASYAPVLRSMEADGFLVGGTQREGKSAFVILLPKLPPLRAFAAAQ